MNTLFLKNDYIQKYIAITLAFCTSLGVPLIYMHLMKISIELGIIHGLVMTLIISIIGGILALICYYLFFSFIFKIKLKNITTYFLVLVLSCIMLLPDTLFSQKIYDMSNNLATFVFIGSIPIGFLIFGGITKMFQKK